MYTFHNGHNVYKRVSVYRFTNKDMFYQSGQEYGWVCPTLRCLSGFINNSPFHSTGIQLFLTKQNEKKNTGPLIIVHFFSLTTVCWTDFVVWRNSRSVCDPHFFLDGPIETDQREPTFCPMRSLHFPYQTRNSNLLGCVSLWRLIFPFLRV